uniref:Glutathione S-transferase n=1 Tax=Panagrolaimus sp. JU765 TaxID=591449 RepID=A0AC34Q2C6_9BILA
MTKYTLQYFKINGRAGGIRLLLDYLKVPYTDEYVDFADWPKIKEATPFGQLPVLKCDCGLQLPETTAIYRYIGAKHGAVADTLEEQALCDALADHLQDYMSKLSLFIGGIMGKKLPRERLQEYLDESNKFFIERLVPDLNKQLKKNGTGYLVGKKPTWVDFIVADTMDSHLYFSDNADKDQLGELIQHKDKIFGLPGVQKRVEERKDLNKQLKKNGTGYLVGKKPTWVDFIVADTMDSHLYFSENADKDQLGELVQHKDKIFGLPGLEKRVEERKGLYPPREMYKF